VNFDIIFVTEVGHWRFTIGESVVRPRSPEAVPDVCKT
jgi:hypothetical protein